MAAYDEIFNPPSDPEQYAAYVRAFNELQSPRPQVGEIQGPPEPRPEDYPHETEGPRLPRLEDYPPYQAPGEVIPRYAPPVGTPSGVPSRQMERESFTPLTQVQQANLLRDQAARMAWGGQMSPDAALRAYGRALLDPSVKAGMVFDPNLTAAQQADAALRQAQNDVSAATLSQPEALQLQRLRMAQAIIRDQHSAGMLTDSNAQTIMNMIGVNARPLVERQQDLPMATMRMQGLVLQHAMAMQEAALQQNIASRVQKEQFHVVQLGSHLFHVGYGADGKPQLENITGPRSGGITPQAELTRITSLTNRLMTDAEHHFKAEDTARQNRTESPQRPSWMPQSPSSAELRGTRSHELRAAADREARMVHERDLAELGLSPRQSRAGGEPGDSSLPTDQTPTPTPAGAADQFSAIERRAPAATGLIQAARTIFNRNAGKRVSEWPEADRAEYRRLSQQIQAMGQVTGTATSLIQNRPPVGQPTQR